MNRVYDRNYELAWMRWGSKVHRWTIHCAHGAAQLHITESYDDRGGIYGGVEFHRRTPPDYAPHAAPHFQQCPVLQGPCWHEGSSLLAEQKYVPLFHRGIDHEAMFDRLKYDMEDFFGIPDEETLNTEEEPCATS